MHLNSLVTKQNFFILVCCFFLSVVIYYFLSYRHTNFKFPTCANSCCLFFQTGLSCKAYVLIFIPKKKTSLCLLLLSSEIIKYWHKSVYKCFPQHVHDLDLYHYLGSWVKTGTSEQTSDCCYCCNAYKSLCRLSKPIESLSEIRFYFLYWKFVTVTWNHGCNKNVKCFLIVHNALWLLLFLIWSQSLELWIQSFHTCT